MLTTLTFFSWVLFSSLNTYGYQQQSSPFGSRYWLIESVTASPGLDILNNGKPETNLLKVVPPCELDDAVLYKPDGTIVTHRGKLKCEDEEEETEETGSYTYHPATKKLVQKNYDSRKTIEATLIESTPSKLVFISTLETGKGSRKITTVYRAK